MKDRRARLRPKDGARQLYYGTAGFINTQGVNLFDDALPWQAAKSAADLAPNFPNILSSVANTASSIGNTISSTLTNFFSNPTDLLNQSFGQGQGLNNIGDGMNILMPLAQTDGLVWPYTPTISYSQAVDYTSYDITHTNQEFLAYTRTKAPTISVSGDFIVQNQTEASYALACVHFLRTIVKMDFGTGSNPGTPPPILLFSAYGSYMFNEVSVIVSNFNLVYKPDVDYVQVPNTDTWVPAMFTIDVQMTVQNSPNVLRQFNLDQFRSKRWFDIVLASFNYHRPILINTTINN